jgi:hypothetical protein
MRSALALTLGLLLGLAVAACDANPVHDNEVSALGAEAPSVAPGPTHRPGQPCLVCHGGSGPASSVFSVGGTIFESKTGTPPVPLSGGTVNLLDTNSSAATATTNTAGNFYLLASAWAPTFPVHVESVAYGGASASMTTHIGRDGSCASCHYDPPDNETPGHVYVVLDPSDFPAEDGGTP